MLSELSIKGLAIINELSLSFAPGFNVITGETGAGKSILIKALSFVLGAKFNAEIVRHGFVQAEVIAKIEIKKDHPAVDLLKSIGIENKDNNIYFIKRIMTYKGRSFAFVNDLPITVSTLRPLGDLLIDILGQHDNDLFDETRHIFYLDQFITDKNLLQNFQKTLNECRELSSELVQVVASYRDKYQSADFFKQRLATFSELDPSEQDYENLLEVCKKFEKNSELKKHLQDFDLFINHDSNGENLIATFRLMLKRLANYSDNSQKISSIEAMGHEAVSLLEQISFEANQVLGNFEDHQAEVDHAQERIALYQSLMRRFSVKDVANLHAEKIKLEQIVKFLETAVSKAHKLSFQLYKKALQLKETSEILTQARKQAALLLEKSVVSELKSLSMTHSRIAVDFQSVCSSWNQPNFNSLEDEKWGLCKDDCRKAFEILSLHSSLGKEKVKFLFSANVGEPLFPLAKVVSGGEASRIMLALKKILAIGSSAGVLVFDEIDVGISGRVADIVGHKMHDLAENFQVISISHLPQVAAYADRHFCVSKSERAEVSIQRLSEPESLQEVARLISGETVTETGIKHAKTLIAKKSESKKKKHISQLQENQLGL